LLVSFPRKFDHFFYLRGSVEVGTKTVGHKGVFDGLLLARMEFSVAAFMPILSPANLSMSSNPW
jgi:hypothetical protein